MDADCNCLPLLATACLATACHCLSLRLEKTKAAGAQVAGRPPCMQVLTTAPASPQVRKRPGAVDAGDHPPITPVAAATREQACACGGFDAWRLYELVARTFLASVSPDARLRVVLATVDVGGEVFEARGREMIESGWYADCRAD